MAPLPMVWMTASVRLKPLSLTWTFHTFLSMPRLRLQLSPSTPKESMSPLPIRPIPTLKVTGMLLKLIKKNLLRTLPVILKGISQWRRKIKRPLPFNNSFFILSCKLLIFDHWRELYPFLPLTLDVNIFHFVSFYSLSLFIRRLCMFIHMLLSVSNF